MKHALLWSLFVSASWCAIPATDLLQHIGSLHIPNAAMVSIAHGFPASPSPVLLVTTFSPLSRDQLVAVNDLAAVVHGMTANVTVLLDNLLWPNYACAVPSDVFGQPAVMAAGGFLIPGKTPGKIVVSLLGSGAHLQLSTNKAGFFYHTATWADMNGDGRLDILTARASKPVVSSPRAEMVWLEQPEDPAQAPWPEHILFEGPGHSFIYKDWTGGTVPAPQILSAGFFAEKDLAVYWCDGGEWPSCPRRMKWVIDDTLGPFFDVQKVDLNRDGRDDLLATNNRADGRGAVLAFERPRDGLRGTWPRHILASGYTPQSSLPVPGKGAPGVSVAFAPGLKKGQKPWILVSGDDAGVVQLLVPDSEDPSDWRYTPNTILKGKGTVGGVAVEDVDGDGTLELFVADYSGGRVEIFRLLPERLTKPTPASAS